MHTELEGIITLKKDEIKAASRVFARAFREDPTSLLPFPEEKVRQVKLPYMFEILLRYNLPDAEAFTTSVQLEGIAIWQRSEVRKRVISLRQAVSTGSLWPTFRMGFSTARKMSPVFEFTEDKRWKYAPSPHWYLMGLGVDPAYQGKGFASRLVKPMLARIDREGMPCYLETAKEKNVAMYQHFGFQVKEEFVVPGTTFPQWAMLRESNLPK